MDLRRGRCGLRGESHYWQSEWHLCRLPISSKGPGRMSDPNMISIQEAAGLWISDDLAYDLAPRGELPGAVQLGRRWRVSLSVSWPASTGPSTARRERQLGPCQAVREHLQDARVVDAWAWPSRLRQCGHPFPRRSRSWRRSASTRGCDYLPRAFSKTAIGLAQAGGLVREGPIQRPGTERTGRPPA